MIPVKVEIKREAGDYLLYRGGKPYRFNGVGFEFGNMESIALHGGTSFRTWRTNNARETGQEVLDKASKYGLTVAMCLEVGSERHGFDYDDANAVKKAAEMPITMLSWLNETIWPLILGGETSAMYMGAIMRAAPTPIPPIIRAITSTRKVGARAEATAETANNTAAYLSTSRRPILSLKGPATIIAKVAVSVRELTDQPNSILVKSNSGAINFTTPEITEASNPIKNPPKATIRAIKTV